MGHLRYRQFDNILLCFARNLVPPCVFLVLSSPKAWYNKCLQAKGLSMGCAVLGRGAESPRFWRLSIWLEPGLSHVTWVHNDATMSFHVSFARYCPFCTFCDLVFLCSN